jgi:hypothetical protein
MIHDILDDINIWYIYINIIIEIFEMFINNSTGLPENFG